MGHKVVYNRCYGGYDLSNEAVQKMKDLGYDYDRYEMIYEVPRHNPDLISVIETLGVDKASGYCSELDIFELPDGCNVYEIEEYDGKEDIIPVYLPDSYIFIK